MSPSQTPIYPCVFEAFTTFTMADLHLALRRLKLRKAPGPDLVGADLYKLLPFAMRRPSARVFQCLLPVCFSSRPLEIGKSDYDLQRRVEEQPFALFISANKLGELYLQSLCCFAPKQAGSPLRSPHQRLSIWLSSLSIHKCTSLPDPSNGRTV